MQIVVLVKVNPIPQNSLRKLCQNTGFLWPIFPRVNRKMRVRENPYSGIFYTVNAQWQVTTLNALVLCNLFVFLAQLLSMLSKIIKDVKYGLILVILG